MLALKKLLTFAAMPLGMAFLLGAGALLLFVCKRSKAGGVLIAVALVQLWLFSTPIVSIALGQALEHPYPAVQVRAFVQQHPEIQAIVVLGGGVDSRINQNNYRPWPDLDNGADRVWYGSKLYAAYAQTLHRHVPVLMSGGQIAWLPGDTSEAVAMTEFAVDLGVPAQHIIQETRSTTTEENAHYTASLLASEHIQRIALVTSAFHMRRAVIVFEQAGFVVSAAPTDQRYPSRAPHWLNWVPTVEHLNNSTTALKEWLWWGLYTTGLTSST